MAEKSKYYISYHARVDNGLCPTCGKPRDDDKVHCSKCREKTNQERKMYQSIMICPNCRKEKLFGEEKICVECRAKFAEINRRVREKHRESYNKSKRDKSREQIAERRKQGLCTRCGKRKADYGFHTCTMCRRKYTDIKRRLKENKTGKMYEKTCHRRDEL